MNEHALELLHVALWVLGAVGTSLVGIGIWGTKKVLELLHDQQLALISIKDMAHAMDLRLTRVEERCSIVTSNDGGYHRRITDIQQEGK